MVLHVIRNNQVLYINFLFYRFDEKVHVCIWDRLHHNLYLPIILGSTEVSTAVVVFICYLKIFLFVRETRNNVSVLHVAPSVILCLSFFCLSLKYHSPATHVHKQIHKTTKLIKCKMYMVLIGISGYVCCIWWISSVRLT